MPDAATVQPAAAQVSDPLAAAHAQLLRDGTLQFDLNTLKIPEPNPFLASFLKGLEPFAKAVGPFVGYVFWAILILGVVAILAIIAREVVRNRFGRGTPLVLTGKEEAWRPDKAKALVLLQDADRLAAEGRYDEAAHLLLLRGVADIAERRPGKVAPSLTSRDIAAMPELPEPARPAFGEIAQVVEHSLFGGRSVTEGGWAACRQAYERLIFAGAWA